MQNALIWVDLEMTGLDLQRDVVIEIAVIVTDSHLQHEIAVRSCNAGVLSTSVPVSSPCAGDDSTAAP